MSGSAEHVRTQFSELQYLLINFLRSVRLLLGSENITSRTRLIMSLTYSNYLKLDTLLAAQEPASETAHDEMLFIITHQTYELWFKQLLHESELFSSSLTCHDEVLALATLRRMLVILKTIVKQTDILETMTPLTFSEFRNRLETASGFQSKQFRMIEFFLGFKNPTKLNIFPENSKDYDDLRIHLNAPSMYDLFLKYINNCENYEIPKDILERDFSNIRDTSDPRVEKVFEKIYKSDPNLRSLCEAFVDFDEGIQEWRYRHIKMVERTIGFQTGTGGSQGASFLQKTLFKPAFPELWQIRNYF